MKVKELIKALEKCDSERLVVLSSDPEGNSFNPCRDVEYTNYCYKDNKIGLQKLTEGLKEDGYTEEDVLNGTPCIVLWAGYLDEEC